MQNNTNLAILFALVTSVQLQYLDSQSSVEDVGTEFACPEPHILCDEAKKTYKVCTLVYVGGKLVKVFRTKAAYNCPEGYLCNVEGEETPCKKDPATPEVPECPEVTTTDAPTTTEVTAVLPEFCDPPNCTAIAAPVVLCGSPGKYYECVYVWWWWEMYQYDCAHCQTEECKNLSSCKGPTFHIKLSTMK